MVELRKRKTPPPPAPTPARKKTSTKQKANETPAVADKPEETTAVPGTEDAPDPPNTTSEGTPLAAAALSSPLGAPNVGNEISLEDFGGEVETNDGSKVTLQKLVEDSKAGVVIFTYPKASTPGCTTQACLFRDTYTHLTSTGFSIYGLSSDSPKSNSTFKTKQNLPYTLLSDTQGTFIKAIGMHKPPKGTKRGVFVVDKSGKVLAAEAGGPAATVQVVNKLVGTEGAPPITESVNASAEESKAESEIQQGKMSAMDVDAEGKDVGEGTDEGNALERVPTQEDKEKANVADEVADTAATLDKDQASGPA